MLHDRLLCLGVNSAEEDDGEKRASPVIALHTFMFYSENESMCYWCKFLKP